MMVERASFGSNNKVMGSSYGNNLLLIKGKVMYKSNPPLALSKHRESCAVRTVFM